MRSISHLTARRLSLIGIVLGLAGCGSAGPSESASMIEQRPVASTAGSAAPRSSASTHAGASAATAESDRYTDLAQSRTPEGYYVLGDPAAPVVLTHYSDFL